MYKENDLTIRPIIDQDLPTLWKLLYEEESPEWKKWDAPYLGHQHLTYDEFINKQKSYNKMTAGLLKSMMR